ncbi:MAG TPA: DUF268 domain-containing protein [Syntrophales bacterium]|nr:DUF268 domain-containing protein [Syntrophales bacterium]
MRLRFIVKGMPLSSFVRGMPSFLRDYLEIRRQAKQSGMAFPFDKFYPWMEDKYEKSGIASGHYFHQDLLVANRIFTNKPVKHVDIGSLIGGFVAHVASFREIEVFDIRELSVWMQNITFRRLDIMDKDFALVDYCDSVSCLHALEHFGLGRYGDRVDYNGHILGWNNIYKMLSKGGKCYFSVPIGPQRIEFNAHRVFSLEYILKNMVSDRYEVDTFSYVDDKGDLVRDAVLDESSVRDSFSLNYGCGIFELTKI